MTQLPSESPRFDSLTLARAALFDLWEARRFHIVLSLIAILPRTAMEALGLLSPYYAGVLSQTMPPGYWNSALLFFLWAGLWNTPMFVMWLRRFLVGPAEVLRLGLGQLVQRSLVFLAYTVALVLALLVLLTVVTLVVSMLTPLFGGTAGSMAPFGFLILIVIASSIFLGARFMLTFAGIPIGHHIPFRESWTRTAAVAGPVIGALALCMVGSVLVAQMAYWLLATPIIGGTAIPAGGSIPPLLHVLELILAPLNYLATGLTAAIMGRVYHSLTPTTA